MSNYKVISTEPISNIEVFNEIDKKAKDTELTYREEKTHEYIKKFAKLKITNFKKAITEITELEISRIDNSQIIKIVELMPSNGTELRAIVSHSGVVLIDENVTNILEVLNKYR